MEPGKDTEFKFACAMLNDRKYLNSFVLNGEMYLIGGYNEHEGYLDSILVKPRGKCVFRPKDEWKMMRAMNSFCTVTYKDKIYTIGKLEHRLKEHVGYGV